MIADRALWAMLLSYPILFAIADNRTVYSDQSIAVDTNPLGTIGTLLQLATFILAAGLTLTRLLSDARDHRPVPPILPYIIVFFATTAAVSAAKGEAALVFGSAGVCLVLAAVSMTPEPPYVVLVRIRAFLRVQIVGSLILGVLIPTWSLVPPEHNSRDFFGIGSRLIGLTAGPNYLGATAAVLFILEVFVATRGRFLRTTFAFLACTAAIWSQSRTGLGIIALACFLALLARWTPRRFLPSVARIFIWGPILAMPVIPFTILLLMDTRADMMVAITTGRVYVWQAAIDAVSMAPFEGLTHQQFNAIVQNYSTEFEFLNAHNQLLETSATGGIIMVIVLILLLLNLGKALVLQAGSHLAPIALSFGVLGQLPFGTPLRLSGITWNLVAVATLVLCTRPWVSPPNESDQPAVTAGSTSSVKSRARAGSMQREAHS